MANNCPCIVEELQQLRELIWYEDIPSPSCPEYVEHHKSIQKILSALDKIIAEVS